MITVDEILKQLRAGQDLDDIGRTICDMMNDAKEQFDKEEAARIQKEKEQKARENKFAESVELLSKIVSYLNNYYPALYEEFFPEDSYDFDVLAQDVTAVLDLGESIYKDPKVKEAILALGSSDWFGPTAVQKVEKKGPKCPSTSTSGSFMDIVNSFLDD